MAMMAESRETSLLALLSCVSLYRAAPSKGFTTLELARLMLLVGDLCE